MSFQIRKAELPDIPAIVKLHVDTWRTAYKGIMPAEYLAALKTEDFEAGWIKSLSSPDRGLTHERWVALSGEGKIIGFLGGGPQRTTVPNYDAELYGIYVLQEYEGLGVARMLAETFASWLLGNNFTAMILWVLKDNAKARGFYEAMGGKHLGIEKEDRQFGESPLIEICYGWSDLNSFARPIRPQRP